MPAQEEIRSSCSEPCSWLCHFCALHSCSWEFPASPPLCQGDARPFCSSIPSAKRGVQKLFPGKESWNHLGWKSSSPTTIPALNPTSHTSLKSLQGWGFQHFPGGITSILLAPGSETSGDGARSVLGPTRILHMLFPSSCNQWNELSLWEWHCIPAFGNIPDSCIFALLQREGTQANTSP